ncbi:MAG: hypothetical protein MUQ30_08205 [Anaerolineae bacterium]|nr:hypothetical protein [Anaerolineae bacterium]
MNARVRSALLVLILVLTLTSGVTAAQGPQDPEPVPASITGGSMANTFTYQGSLEEGGTLANGSYNFIFTLWESSAPAAYLVDTLNAVGGSSAYIVEDGFFSFHLIPATKSFSDVFDGGERWIQVQVRPTGALTYTKLPRQAITGVPYAWSLLPGAVITGTIANDSTLYVGNACDAGTIGSALYAENHADTSPTIYGRHYGTGHALYGTSSSGYPTVGGVNTGSGPAVLGSSTSGHGVLGSTEGNSDSGVVGLQSGYTTSDLSNFFAPGGLFGGYNGVAGVTKQGTGYAVLGFDQSSGGSWAGYFISNNGSGVYASVPSGNVGLNTNGTKPAVVNTDDGARLLYTEESTEVWFTDYGFDLLDGGQVTIVIDTTFAQTVNLDEPYHVFVEPYGPASLYVTDRTPTGFTVHAREGEPDVELSYRLVAGRLGYEDHRLERAPWADSDPNVNPNATRTAQMQPAGGGEQ